MRNRHWQTWAHHQVNKLPRHSHVTASVHSVDLARRCGHARLIAAPHSRQRFPVCLQRFPHRRENNRCSRAVQHGETASGSTMKEPWPKPVDDSQRPEYLPEELFILSPEISAPEFQPKEYSVDGVSTTEQATQVVQQFGAESVKQTPKNSGSSSPFVCALPTTSGDPGVVVFCCEPGPVIAMSLSSREEICSLLFAVQYVQQAQSLSVLPRSPVRSSAVPRSDTDGKDVNQWRRRISQKVNQRGSYVSRCSDGRDTQSVKSDFCIRILPDGTGIWSQPFLVVVNFTVKPDNSWVWQPLSLVSNGCCPRMRRLF